MENFYFILMTYFRRCNFYDVINMTSYPIILKIYCVIINLWNHKLAKSCNFGSLRSKKSNYSIFLQFIH